MVLVCLGTQDLPFTRLLEMVEKSIDEGLIHEEVVAQVGYTKYDSTKMKQFAFCSSEEMQEYIKQASYIITHAGTGTIVSSLKLGKKIIAVNRLKKFGEHTDDHQIEIIREFAQTGYLIPCYENDELGTKIRELENFQVPVFQSNTSTILQYLRSYIDGVIKN